MPPQPQASHTNSFPRDYLPHSNVAAIFWCLYCINDSTLDYTLNSAIKFKWIFGPTLKPWYLNEYLVPHWNLDARMNIWSLLETLMLEWIFGHTLKPWYSNEYLVPHWNLDARMNIWSHLETFILAWIFGPTFKPWYLNEQFVWIFNGMYVNAMPGLVKCFWCNLGYRVVLNIHAFYVPHSTLHDKVHAEL